MTTSAQQHTLSMLRSSADLNGRSPRIWVRSSVFTTCTAPPITSDHQALT